MTRFKKSKAVDVLKVLEFYLKILLYFIRTKPSYVNCHSLSVLPIAPFFKILCGSKIIYDAHELETCKFGIGKRLQFVIFKVEKAFVYFVDHIVVVSNSIGVWYQNNYPAKSVSVVRNIPVNKLFLDSSDQKSNYLRNKFNIPSEHIIFIYQGIISEERGIRVLLDVFSKIESNFHIVFMGYGVDVDLVKQNSSEKKNIHFHVAVKQNELRNITSSADVGLCILKSDSLSHYYCLPNKVFEYILSDLPIIASNFPDLKEFVELNNFGWVCEPKMDAIMKIVTSIKKIEIKKCVEQIKIKKCKYDWRNEEIIYAKIFS